MEMPNRLVSEASGVAAEVDLSAFLDMIGGNEVVVTTKVESVFAADRVEGDADDAFSVGSLDGEPSSAASETTGEIPDIAVETTGISSSLLEVISELRKRTKSEGDQFLAASSAPTVGKDAVEEALARNVDSSPTKKLRPGSALSDAVSTTVAHRVVSTSSSPSLVRSFTQSSSSTSSSSSSSPTRLVSPRPLLVVDDGGKSFVICANCDFLTASIDEYNRHNCHVIERSSMQRCGALRQKQQLRSQIRHLLDESTTTTTTTPSTANDVDSSAELRVRFCLSCSREFPSAYALNEHKREGDEVKCKFTLSLHCQSCDFAADERVEMEEHVYLKHAHGRGLIKLTSFYLEHFKCDLCGFVSSNIRSLKSHMKRHVNDLVYRSQINEFYACNLCNASYIHLPSLKTHMWKHATCDSYDFTLTNDVLSAAIDFDRKPTRQTADRKLKSLINHIQSENLPCHVIFGCSAGRRGGGGGRKGVQSRLTPPSGNHGICSFRTLDRQLLQDHILSHGHILSHDAKEPLLNSRPNQTSDIKRGGNSNI